jgi:hypothetical protein
MSDISNTYYASESKIGYGAQFLVGQGDGSPETFTAVPEINSITLGDMTTGVVDVTHLRSPGRHREKIGTIRDSGPISLSGNYRPDHGAHRQAASDGFVAGYSLFSLWRNVTPANFGIYIPDVPVTDGGSPGETGQILPVRGIVTKYQPGGLTLEGVQDFTAEITPLRDYTGDWA